MKILYFATKLILVNVRNCNALEEQYGCQAVTYLIQLLMVNTNEDHSDQEDRQHL